MIRSPRSQKIDVGYDGGQNQSDISIHLKPYLMIVPAIYLASNAAAASEKICRWDLLGNRDEGKKDLDTLLTQFATLTPRAFRYHEEQNISCHMYKTITSI